MFKIDSATGHTALRDAFRDFLCNTGSAFGLTYEGVGGGELVDYRGGADSVAETFTIEATNATTFTVTGSVSGSLPNATVGTPYDEDEIAFTIENDSSTAFQAGDTFTLSTAPKWEALRDSSPDLILKAPGNDGVSEIFTGIRTFEDAGTDYYNWELAGYDGFNDGLDWQSQPNAHRQLYVPLWQNAIPYWFVADGRRAAMVAKVSTVYVTAYMGLLQPYLDPTVYPYPLCLGGTMAFNSAPASNSANWRWSNSSINNSAFPFSDLGGVTYAAAPLQARMRGIDGNWWGGQARANGNLVGVGTMVARAAVLPASGGGSALRDGPDGSFPLIPVEYALPTDFLGRLDGFFMTSGFGVGAETAHRSGIRDFVAFPNVFRTGINDWFALELD